MESKQLTLTPNHFSVESGFQSGVVVEYESFEGPNTGYFHRVADLGKNGLKMHLFAWKDGISNGRQTFEWWVDVGNIKWIRLLTGPMRFWAGAPNWAGFCTVHKLNGHVSYYTGKEEIDRFIMGESDIDQYEVTMRPFWCNFGKEN